MLVQVRVTGRLIQKDERFTAARGPTRDDVVNELQSLQTATPKLSLPSKCNTMITLENENTKDDFFAVAHVTFSDCGVRTIGV